MSGVPLNIVVPVFTAEAKLRLNELVRDGYQITGYCFERLTTGTVPQRGFVDFAGFVGWMPANAPTPIRTEVGWHLVQVEKLLCRKIGITWSPGTSIEQLVEKLIAKHANCEVSPVSSRACEVGTRGCTKVHIEGSQT